MTVIGYPHMAEKSMSLVDEANTIVFVVDRDATKIQVKQEMEERFNVAVWKVNTQITQDGVKKAYIRLSPQDDAIDVATRLEMM